MMSSDNNTPPLVQPPDHNRTKTPPSARKTTPQKVLPEPAPLKCPRCDSSNTKFCYYNNYNLTQPRHFCKTCRRYWTKGGALRNVPIGGGCRKTRKYKPPSTSSSSSPFSCPDPSSGLDLLAGTGGEGEGEFKFLAPPTMTPAVEFQLGGLSLPRLHPATAGVYTQFIANSGAQHHLHQPPIGVMGSGTGCFGLDLLGPSSNNNNNYPPTFPTLGNNNSSSPSPLLSLASGGGVGAGGGGGCGGGDQPLTISSIESLSSINQEMHWKLQQQRLAMLYGQPSFEDDNNNSSDQEKPLGGINLFKSLESARNDNKLPLTASSLTPTDWLCDQISANYGDNNNNINNNNNNNNNNNINNNNNNNININSNSNNNSSNMSVTSTTTSCNNHQGFWTTDLQQHQQQFNGLH